MDTTQSSSTTGEAPRSDTKGRRWPWALALAAIVTVGGIAAWLLLADGEGRPTLTFEGDALTYSGPMTFDERVITLENTSDGSAAFAWGLISDDSITLEDEVAYRGPAPPPGSSDGNGSIPWDPARSSKPRSWPQ